MRKQIATLLMLSAAIISAAGAQTYSYDGAGRLTQVAYPNGGGIRYVYDAADNLLSASGISLPPAPVSLDVVRTSPTTARLTWAAPQGGATGVVIMRRTQGNTIWEEVATVAANITSFVDSSLDPAAQYVYRIAARGADGLSAYSRELSPSTASSVHMAVAGLGARTLSTLGESDVVQSGYAVLDVESGSTPYGTAVFSYAQNGVVVTEAGVPASPPTRSARIFIDYRTNFEADANHFTGRLTINTGFAIVNRGGRSANLTFTLRDLEGRTVAGGGGMLTAGAHFAGVISDLRSLAPDFSLPPEFPATTRFGSLAIESDQMVSVMALRSTINQRGEVLFTTTPVADLAQPLSFEPAYFPQFADGGGFSTSLFLLNPSDRVQSGTIEIFASNGSPLTVKPVGAAAASSFSYNIQPGGAFVLESDGSTPSVTSGWVRLTPGFAGAVPVAGGAFRVVQQGIVVNEAGVPAATPTTRARLYVDNSGGHDTGIAIANPRDTGAAISLRVYEMDGKTTVSEPASFSLDPRGHRANVARDLVSGLPAGFRGLMEVSSPTPFVALTLRALINSRGELLFATFPNADLTRPAPAPVIFPHLADGGGFRTEFILLGPITPAQTTLRLFGQDGKPLDVADLP